MNSAEISRILSQYDKRRDRRPEFIPVPVDSMISLQNALIFGGVEWESWSAEPGAKDIDILLKEVDEGETTFVRNRKGELIRKVTKATINVIRVDSDGKFRLYEEIFTPHGWIRRHKDPISHTGVKEKALYMEKPLETALRGLHEEMRVKDLSEDELKDLVFIESRVEELESSGYPGLNTRYTFSDFKFKLPLRFYRPEYYFREGRRRMRLLWEKIV